MSFFKQATIRLGQDGKYHGDCPECGMDADFEHATKEDPTGFCHECQDAIEGTIEEGVDETGTLTNQTPLDGEGRVRINAARCSTCIFYPGSPFRGEGDVEFLARVKDAQQRRTVMVCHSTAYQKDGCKGGAAVCNGFWKVIVPLDEQRKPPYKVIMVNEHLKGVKPEAHMRRMK